MSPGRAVGAAVVYPVLTFALTTASFSAPAPAGPRDSETGRRPGDAREHGGAIRRRDPGCAAEAGDRARRLEDLKGRLRPPVAGPVVRTFGEPDHEGRPSKGIVLRARPGAQVVAPFDSTITFAGPVEDFGQTLILSTWDGYHFVLAGITKIFGVEDQKLLEGEPVGVMGTSEEGIQVPEAPRAPGTGDASSGGAGPGLYFEIRKNGEAVDPLPWLAIAKPERTSP